MDISETNISSDENKFRLSTKRALALFVTYILILNVITLIFSFFIGIYVGVTTGNADPGVITKFITPFMLPVSIVSLIVSFLVVLKMTRNTLPGSIKEGALVSIGWVRTASPIILIAFAIGVAVAIFYLFIVIPLMPTPTAGQSYGPLATAAQLGGWQRLLWAIIALLLAPPIEEFIFRGVLFSGVSNSIGVFFSAVITTLIFIVIHIPEAQYYWPTLIGIGALSIATIFFRIKTKSFIPAIAVHFSYNLVIVVTVYLHAT